ncbi:MAG: DUF4330 domain-containing protein [Clostridia bacterium]|nr:DUF4330 domain-containing protein [Clostridia bacterium]
MKNGKLFGKISIVDIAVVLLLAVLVAGVILRIGGNSGEVISGATYECVVKVESVRQYTVDALTKGGEVYDKTTKEYIGTITGVTTEPATDHLLMADGSHKVVPVDNRYHAYVTIAFQGKETPEGYFTSSNQQMYAGGTLVMNAKWTECTGEVQKVYAK